MRLTDITKSISGCLTADTIIPEPNQNTHNLPLVGTLESSPGLYALPHDLRKRYQIQLQIH